MRSCGDEGSIPLGCGPFNNFFSNILILTIMKEAFKKIENLAHELNETVKPKVGGGYIIIASENSNDEDASTLSVMNGHGVALLGMMTKAFLDSPDMREFAKAAAIAADAMEARLLRKKQSEQPEPTDGDCDRCAPDAATEE